MIENRITEYILPKKILKIEGEVINSDYLLKYNSNHVFFKEQDGCVMEPHSYILFDFGKEYSGGVKIIRYDLNTDYSAKIHITFGESASEALSLLKEKGSCNDHSIRDDVLSIPFGGELNFGNTGYRFIKIENVNNIPIYIKQVFGTYIHNNYEVIGSFKCNDEMINKVWDTGVRTIFLNMQDYVYDGIKRDRAVWIGDMHPETSAILRLFGKNECVEKSLEFIKENTPANKWMNNTPSYSMWWVKILYDYYFYTGDKVFLDRQINYLNELVPQLLLCINDDGSLNVDYKFIDWPSNDNEEAKLAGLKSLLVISLNSAIELLKLYEITDKINKIIDCANKKIALLKQSDSSCGNYKQTAALLAYSNIKDAKEINEKYLSKDYLSGVSTFLGYYVLLIRAMADDIKGSLDLCRNYWGAMINLNATTFWEDFNIDWIKNAKPIDSLLENNEYDVHGDNGAYCYKGFRHSLCHGWASGPVPFLSEYVLGIKVIKPGCKQIIIKPDLGDLKWAEGTFPTPYGTIYVKHEKVNNEIKTIVKAPKEVKFEIAK